MLPIAQQALSFCILLNTYSTWRSVRVVISSFSRSRTGVSLSIPHFWGKIIICTSSK
nr:MAG TPA: hypothetical protein [Caudoviricetes sp.]